MKQDSPLELLVTRLAQVGDARHLLVRAPAGSGAHTALVPIVAHAAQSGLVVILAIRRAELEQWKARLDEAGVDSRIATPEVALELTDRQPTNPPAGVLLATPMRLDRGVLRNALQSVAPALLLADVSPQYFTAAPRWASLIKTASRSIVLDELGTGPMPEWLGARTALVELSLNEVINGAAYPHASVDSYDVVFGQDEQEVVDRAAKILGQPVSWRSRVVLHTDLLQFISDAEQASDSENDEVAEAWRVVDDLENLGPDPRADAVLEATNRLRQTAPVIVVTGGRLVEADYVRDYLTANGVDAALWTAHSRPSTDRTESGTDGPPFPVAVATTGGLETNGQRLAGTALVYFTQPHTAREQRRLLVALATGAIESASTPLFMKVHPNR